MEKFKTILRGVLYTLCIYLLGFYLGWRVKPEEVREVTKVEVITEVVTPEPVETVVEKIVRIPVEKVVYRDTSKTNITQDSVKVEPPQSDSDSIDVKWESKHYSDPNFDLWISGILPQVDSMKVYSETKIVTENIVKDRWELGPFINGEFNKDFTFVSAGAELAVPYRGWEFSVNGGYGIWNTGNLNHGWIIGARVKYNIFYR